MSNSGSSTPESDDTFISVQENFDLNPVLDINTQESVQEDNNVPHSNDPRSNDADVYLDQQELERIFSKPFEEVIVSEETNLKLEQLAKEKENQEDNKKGKELLPGDARRFYEGTRFKAVSLNEIEEAKMATIAEKTMNQTHWGVKTFKGK